MGFVLAWTNPHRLKPAPPRPAHELPLQTTGGGAFVLHFLLLNGNHEPPAKKRMKKISVQAANGKYEVLCGRGALAALPRLVSRIAPERSAFVISSPRVWRHCGERIERLLGASRRATILIDDAETAKNLSTVERA